MNQSSLLIARDLRVDGFGRLIGHPYNASKDKAAAGTSRRSSR
ncbi:hypothetical protein ACFTAO_15220 [Paenibacillus rhizoplanae]|uniref:Uncharacterized protein n=1 Tax=Paenibacillus rhizoplanae TaxID=1917181 RepID=A0ABW5F091_9BACL